MVDEISLMGMDGTPLRAFISAPSLGMRNVELVGDEISGCADDQLPGSADQWREGLMRQITIRVDRRRLKRLNTSPMFDNRCLLPSPSRGFRRHIRKAKSTQRRRAP